MSWITLSFRNLLAISLVGLVLLAGVPTLFYISLVHTRQLVDERGKILHSLANTAATVLSENLRERAREVDLLAKTKLYVHAPLDSPEFQASLTRVQQSYSHYSWIGLADLDGQVRAATGGLLIGQSVAERPWFQQAQRGGYVGDLHEAKLLAKLLPHPPQDGPLRFIDFATLVRDEHAQPRAVLGVHAHWAWAKELLHVVTPSDAKTSGVEFFIVNRHNDIIFPDQPASSAHTPTPPTMDTGLAARYDTWGSDTDYLTAVVAIKEPPSVLPLGWRVLVRQPKMQVLMHVKTLQTMIVTVSAVAVVAFVACAALLGRLLGRSVQLLTQTAQSIAQGQPATFDLRLRTAEMRKLQDALQQMSAQLLTNQRDLAAAARDLEKTVAQRTQELADANLALSALARQDTLTGMPNRLAANEFLAHEFHLLTRRPQPYAVILMDIDYFKKVNDIHGHAIGDAVLKHVGEVLLHSVRESDFVGRVGGEEFMAVLPMTPLHQALGTAEKIRAAVEASPIAPVGKVTLSIGVAEAHSTHTSDQQAIALADEQLYAAKHAGRNRVMPSPTH